MAVAVAIRGTRLLLFGSHPCCFIGPLRGGSFSVLLPPPQPLFREVLLAGAIDDVHKEIPDPAGQDVAVLKLF